MSLTYRGWICIDVDGTRWGRDESHRALVYPTAAEARAGGIAHVREVMADEDVCEKEVARFSAESVAVEVSIRCDVEEQGLAALRWLAEDSLMQVLSDGRLVGLQEPGPEPSAGAFRSEEAARSPSESIDPSRPQPGDVLTSHGWDRPGEWTRPGADPEPDPVPNDGPAVWDLVLADIQERDALGRQRYGTPLRPHNGRKPLRDLYQELLDAVAYTRQELFEREGR